MAKVISLINNKGGVGKTTTAVNLAAGIALTWRRVLLIDLDTQGSASLSLGIARDELEPSSADLLLRQRPISEVIRKTSNEWMDVITGSLDLSHTDIRLAQVQGRENRLRSVLQQVRNDYDFILIDCPPSMSMLPVNALVASDAFIVPVVPEYLAIEGLANLGEAISRMRNGVGIRAEMLGIVLTMVDYRTKATKELVEMMRSSYGDQIFESEIRVNVRLSEAPSFGKNIFEYDGASSGAGGYTQLTGEVVARCRRQVPAAAVGTNGKVSWPIAG